MAVSQTRSLTLSADGRSSWVPLIEYTVGNAICLNRIVIRCEDWAGSSVELRYNIEDSTNDCPVEDSFGTITVTSNRVIELFGPGYVGAIVSSYGGTEITFDVIDTRYPLPGRTVGI